MKILIAALLASSFALAQNPQTPVERYNLACELAKQGTSESKEKAISLLTALVEEKAAANLPLATDPDLASLASDQRFIDLKKRVREQRQPCWTGSSHPRPEYRQLDFWIGEWNVYAGTQKVGESSIQLILGDCVISENWTGLASGSGKSYNKFNAAKNTWEQFWVDDSGNTIDYSSGIASPNKMVFMTDPRKLPDGSIFVQRLTFSLNEDKSVRQFSETSSDGGQAWKTQYDFKYVRK